MHRLLLLIALLVSGGFAAEAGSPRPPCGGGPTDPSYARPGTAPNVGVWSESDLEAPNGQPAACLGWSGRSRLAVALAGEFAMPGGLDTLLRRIGSFSHYGDIRYWSTSRREWQPLVRDAGLLPAAAPSVAQRDLPPERFVAGQTFDYFEVDAAGRSTYRMTVRERGPDRVVLAIENTSPIRLAFVSLFEPRALQTVLFLDHRDGNLWRSFQAIRAADGTSSLALRTTASYVNRLTAFYGYLSGQPASAEEASRPTPR
jgi:hypothetical protein